MSSQSSGVFATVSSGNHGQGLRWLAAFREPPRIS
jgi:threonine dehydratase